MTHIHIIRKPSENFYLVGSPAENVFVAASQITLLNYYLMRIATNSDAINKGYDFGQPRIRTFGSICLPCGINFMNIYYQQSKLSVTLCLRELYEPGWVIEVLFLRKSPCQSIFVVFKSADAV